MAFTLNESQQLTLDDSFLNLDEQKGSLLNHGRKILLKSFSQQSMRNVFLYCIAIMLLPVRTIR